MGTVFSHRILVPIGLATATPGVAAGAPETYPVNARFWIVLAVIIAVAVPVIVYHILTKGGGEDDKAYYMGAGLGESNIRTLLWSKDGVEWKTTENAFESSGRFVEYYSDQEIWLATGCDTVNALGTILWSKDGKKWNNAETGGFDPGAASDKGGYNITYNSFYGLWVAVGGSTTQKATIQWSADGKHWNHVDSGGFTVGKFIYFDRNEQTYVATGIDSVSKDTIQYSTDGKNWSVSTSDTNFTTGGSIGGVWVTGKNR